MIQKNTSNRMNTDNNDIDLFEPWFGLDLAKQFILIKNSHSAVTSLKLDNINVPNIFNERVWRRVGQILGDSNDVKELYIQRCNDVDVGALFNGLKYNRCIQKIHFLQINLRDADQNCAIFLSTNPSLKDISICNCNLGGAVNILLSALFNRSKDTLERLNLSEHHIGLGGIYLEKLVYTLHTKCKSLRSLNLDDNGIGRKGCTLLAKLLKNEESKLEELHLYDNSLDSDCAIILADALLRNTTLKRLGLRGNRKINTSGWAAILQLVCDTSSINNVIESNHTLSSVGMFVKSDVSRHRRITYALGADSTNILRAALELNAIPNKRAVIRQKIIWGHTREDFNIGNLSIPTAAIPLILACFGDDANTNLVQYDDPPLQRATVDTIRLESIYNIIRARPDLICKKEIKRDYDILYIFVVVFGLLLSLVIQFKLFSFGQLLE